TKDLGFVPGHARPRRNFSEFGLKFSLAELFRVVRWLRFHRPQYIVFFRCPWWMSFAAWLAAVPIRIGPRSQWHSFLFLNIGIRQRRSQSKKHESDYNFELIERAFLRLGA